MSRVALPFGRRTPESKRGPYREALRAANIQPVENVATMAGLDGLLLALLSVPVALACLFSFWDIICNFIFSDPLDDRAAMMLVSHQSPTFTTGC